MYANWASLLRLSHVRDRLTIIDNGRCGRSAGPLEGDRPVLRVAYSWKGAMDPRTASVDKLPRRTRLPQVTASLRTLSLSTGTRDRIYENL
jgi:hypothetical protein